MNISIGQRGGANQDDGLAWFGHDQSGNFHGGLSSTVVSDGLWHFIVGVREGTDYRIYIDGILEGTNNGSMGNPGLQTYSQPMYLGRHDNWNTNYTGDLADFFMMNKILSDEEVLTMYNDYINGILLPSEAGTYFVTYDAEDTVGNQSTAQRTVEVLSLHQHPADDTTLDFGAGDDNGWSAVGYGAQGNTGFYAIDPGDDAYLIGLPDLNSKRLI